MHGKIFVHFSFALFFVIFYNRGNMTEHPYKPFSLICKGHSTAKWIAEHFPYYQELMSPIMRINPNHLIYPHYVKMQMSDGTYSYIVRLMSKENSPIHLVENEKGEHGTFAVPTRLWPGDFNPDSLYEVFDE